MDKAQLARQGKLVPALIERMELVDLQLVTLGKLCAKTDDVHCFIKRSSARDFKIDHERLQEAREAADLKAFEKKRKMVILCLV